MIYWNLFLVFLQIGAFSFGGGYAALPLIENLVVQEHGWLTMAEFTDLITISQMTPGPIAINSATFIGTQLGGVPGALAATLGSVLPSMLIVSFLAYLYNRYRNISVMQNVLVALRPGVVALIAASGVSILITALWGPLTLTLANINWVMVILFLASLYAIMKLRYNAIVVILLAGVANTLWYIITTFLD